MSKQLEIFDRPWIKDTVSSASDFTFQDKPGAFTWAITIRTENVGHSVATAIFPDAKLIAVQGADFIDGPREQARELCDTLSERFEKLKDNPIVWSNAVFPNEHLEFPWNVVLLRSQMETNAFDGGKSLGKSVIPMLIGCVEYRYATSEKAHRTWFVYTLSHTDQPELHLPTQVFFSIGKTVRGANMVLLKSGQFAD